MEKDKHLGIKIDRDIYYKLHYISKYEDRSANGHILNFIRNFVSDFENKNGIIEPHNENEK